MSEQKAQLQINTTNYLRTFKEFIRECQENVPSFSETFITKNWTEQDHAGWTESLYQAQDGILAIEYMQTRIWRFHFNGVIGEGLTLEDAIKNHKVKYDEHIK